MIAEEVLSNHR